MFTAGSRCGHVGCIVAALVWRWTASWRSDASQDRRCRHTAIAHTRSADEVLQDAHRPSEQQSDHCDTGVHREELSPNLGDGRGQAASGCWLTASMPSMNFTPVTTFGNWLWPSRRRQFFSAACASLNIMASAVL